MTDIALFGVTGDLAKQKLISALFKLYISGNFTKESRFFGFGRKAISEKEFADFIKEHCGHFEDLSPAEYKRKINTFAERWSYIESELDHISGYKKLNKALGQNAVIYISLPPQLQMPVSKLLIESKTVSKNKNRRVAYEKPFGTDSQSAKKLQKYLIEHLDESQILRVDHYAGKQAILDIEKMPALGIESVLFNKAHISKIEVTLYEKKTAEGRGAFYDSVGALYDVGQNHLPYMLSTVLAVPLLACDIAKKCQLSELRALALENIVFNKKAKLGQYEGFIKEDGVKPDSKTETFFAIKGKVKSDLSGKLSCIASVWGGVPVVMSGGKAMAENDVAIYFHLKNSKKVIRIPVNTYGMKDAHEEIFKSAISGNMNRFMSMAQVLASWRLVEGVKKAKNRLIIYKKGSVPN